MKPDFELGREQLAHTLREHQIPIDKWGKGSAKTLDHLFQELVAGESHLIFRGPELIRTFDTVHVRIFTFRDGVLYTLREDRQVFSDGRQRERPPNTSIAEKMQPNETPVQTAKRAVEEELGIYGTFSFVPIETDTMHRVTMGNSYPGIISDTNIHIFLLELGEEHFNPKGYKEEQTDKTTYFVWEKVDNA